MIMERFWNGSQQGFFIAWSSLIKSIPVNWKREIEGVNEDIGPACVGNALPIMTVKNVYS